MPVIFIKNVSEAGVEPAISRLEVGRDIHFATRTHMLTYHTSPLSPTIILYQNLFKLFYVYIILHF